MDFCKKFYWHCWQLILFISVPNFECKVSVIYIQGGILCSKYIISYFDMISRTFLYVTFLNFGKCGFRHCQASFECGSSITAEKGVAAGSHWQKCGPRWWSTNPLLGFLHRLCQDDASWTCQTFLVVSIVYIFSFVEFIWEIHIRYYVNNTLCYLLQNNEFKISNGLFYSKNLLSEHSL